MQEAGERERETSRQFGAASLQKRGVSERESIDQIANEHRYENCGSCEIENSNFIPVAVYQQADALRKEMDDLIVS